jgi:hypothetical protein
VVVSSRESRAVADNSASRRLYCPDDQAKAARVAEQEGGAQGNHTPKAGERVDHHRLTQVGRAMRELGIQMIPAYTPQARGRCERTFGTWQNRLPLPGAKGC